MLTLLELTPHHSNLFIEALHLVDRTQGKGIFSIDYFSRCSSEPNSLLVAALLDRKLIGIAAARVLYPESGSYYKKFGHQVPQLILENKTGSLETMSVHETNQRQGIGRTLMEYRLAWLRKRNCTWSLGISWVSRQKNTSKGIFEKLNFTPVSEVVNFYEKDSVEKHFQCPSCGNPPCKCSAILYMKRIG